ncbi:MAG: DUF624 domain-containing protein [Oscillospiraceae bacterium]
MGIFNNYTKAGPGVPKVAPKKSRFTTFFEIFFRKFWKLIQINLLYLAFCIPVVTIGPATAGLVKVLRNYSQEKNAFIWGDFFETFKKEFKRSFVIGLIDIAIIVLLYFCAQVYPTLAATNKVFILPFILSLSLGLVIMMMHFYIYLLIVSVDLSFKDTIKNAFILTFAGMKSNILTLLFSAILVVGTVALSLFVSPLFSLLFIVILVATIWLIICFNSYPVIQKFVINPYYEEKGEESPEFAYLKPITDNETVFTDKGGTELPIKPQPKEKRGKIIS